MPFAVPVVRFAEAIHWPPHHQIDSRRLYDHELLYVVSGSLQVQFQCATIVLGADQLMMLTPEVQHRLGTLHDPHSHLGIHFDWLPRPDSARTPLFRKMTESFESGSLRPVQVIPGWERPANHPLDLRGRPRVRQLLYEVIGAHRATGTAAQWKAGSLLAAAIAQIWSEACLLGEIAANPGFGADAARRVHQARELLEESRQPLATIEEAAAHVGWSPDHLGRMCRKLLGISPYRLQMESRMRHAQVLLRYGNVSIADIARRCCFSDAAHFTRSFKGHTGLTPSQFALRGQPIDSKPALPQTGE